MKRAPIPPKPPTPRDTLREALKAAWDRYKFSPAHGSAGRAGKRDK